MGQFAMARGTAMMQPLRAFRVHLITAALTACVTGFTTGAVALDARHPTSAETAAPVAFLSAEQARAFRAWFVRIVDAQFVNGPTPRWTHRDCAGLVRFAVAEALRDHDAKWLHANSIGGLTPPELALTAEQRELRHSWRLANGTKSAYVGALELVQENTRFISKDINQAQAGDLLLFDQGDDQHLMIWTGRYIAYHTGSNAEPDNGLRAASMQELMSWRDTRWQPVSHNPNFVGIFRLRFLAR